MRIKAQLHTVFFAVGPHACGKTEFLREKLVPALYNLAPGHLNVQLLSSDSIRRELLGDTSASRDDPRMQAVSAPAFELLLRRLDLVTSFPVNAHFVVVDTTGLSADFRGKVRAIVERNHFRLAFLLFDYQSRKDFFRWALTGGPIGGGEAVGRSPAVSQALEHQRRDIERMRKEVLPALGKKAERVRIHSPDDVVEIVDVEMEDWKKCQLAPNFSYFVIGDVHCSLVALKALLTKVGFQVDGDRVRSDWGSDCATRIVLVGDYVDKGPDNAAIIDFVHQNQFPLDPDGLIYVVRGNHESSLQHALTPAGREKEPHVFTSHAELLQESAGAARERFAEVYKHSFPFLAFQATTPRARSFVVTHAPCPARFLGKLDTVSLRLQRGATSEFVWDPAPADAESWPLHIFGHMTTKRHFDGTRHRDYRLALDTGAAHGGTLTGVFVGESWRKPSFVSVDAQMLSPLEARRYIDFDALTKGVPAPALAEKKESKETKGSKEAPKSDDRRLDALLRNRVNYISGTVAPAPADPETGELESLDKALDHFAAEFKRLHCSSQTIHIEPKWMGSRANLYLAVEEPYKSFAVSRNGFLIPQRVSEPLFAVLKAQVADYVRLHEIALLVVDGELMPWSALGAGLIDGCFRAVGSGLDQEIAALTETGVEAQVLALERARQGGAIGDKITAQLATRLARMWPLDAQREALATYNQQLDLFAEAKEPWFEPFSVLKYVKRDGTEVIPESQVESFRAVSRRKSLLLDFTTVDLPRAKELASSFFHDLTVGQHMEGIMIKPNVMEHAKQTPFMKVRNGDYLSIIYGYDYRSPKRHDKLIAGKNIKRKLEISRKEYQLGKEMLRVPFSTISAENQEYRHLLARFLHEEGQESTLDKRL